MAQTPWGVPLITPLVNLPFGWRPSLVPESLSLTWNPSFLRGAILVHPGPRLLVNWPPPFLPSPFSFPAPQRFPISIMCLSTMTSRYRLHIVQYTHVPSCCCPSRFLWPYGYLELARGFTYTLHIGPLRDGGPCAVPVVLKGPSISFFHLVSVHLLLQLKGRTSSPRWWTSRVATLSSYRCLLDVICHKDPR